MKVYTVSDVHVDYPENMDWILSLDAAEYRQDILVLAGDISHNLEALERVFKSLLENFKSLNFIPGNDELWGDGDEFGCSLEKFKAVNQLCEETGVKINQHHYCNLTVVPLHGWYDFSFGEPDKHLARAWRDFRACVWPPKLESSKDVNEYFLNLNKTQLNITNDIVISYSHFLPRIDVMPSYIPHDRRRVYPVLGSNGLGEQVKKLNPDIHIYGHSHVNQSIKLDDIRFVNNAFAYPTENRIARKELHCVFDWDD